MKKFKTAGYRVHFDRLRSIYPAISAIRTHKFKCTIPKNAESDLKEKFRKVAKVVDSSKEGSVLWFLIQLYGLGFLFCSKESGKLSLLESLDKDILLSEVQDILSQASWELKKEIKNPLALYNFLTTTPREVIGKLKETGILPTGVLVNLGAIFSDEKITQKNFRANDLVLKYHNSLKDFVLKRGDLKEKDIQDFFQIYPQKLETEGTTFVIKSMDFAVLQENAKGKTDIYKAYFQYLQPAAKATKKKEQSLAGVDDNQNGLSNLLGNTLKKFQESEKNCKRLITYANPVFFSKNLKYLDFLAETVHNLAKKVGQANEIDFFRKNWQDYRNLVGGRLEGWISNFQNRLNAYEKHLFDEYEEVKKNGESETKQGGHKIIFDKIDELDYQKLFPENQRINFEKLKELRPRIADSLQKVEQGGKTKDLGSLLFEYNRFLAEFREFLMRWNNEGIPERVRISENNFLDLEPLFNGKLKEFKAKPKKGEDKKENERKILGYWSMAKVPKELEQYPRFIGQAQKDPEDEIEKAYEKLLSYVVAGNKFVEEIQKQNPDRDEFFLENWIDKKKFYLKVFENLKDLAFRAKNQQKIWDFLGKYVDLEAIKNHEKKEDLQKWWNKKDRRFLKFLVTPYHRFKYTAIPVDEEKIKDFSKFREDFAKAFDLEKLKSEDDFIKFFNLTGKNVNLDNGELLKMYWGLCLRDLPQSVKMPDFLADFEILAQTSCQSLVFDEENDEKILKSGNLPRKIIQRFVASGISSEIRGKLSLLSRNSFIERNVIQTTNGEQSFLQYIPLEWGTRNFTEKSEDELEKMNGRQRRRYKLALEKSQNRKENGFSDISKAVLKSYNWQDFNNKEIANEIWKKMPKEDDEVQRIFTKVLAEIPHRWAMVLRTKTLIKNMEPMSTGCFIEKSSGKNVFNFVTRKSDNLYAFPIETSVVQKQFLERFLWGDKDNILHEFILGSTVILEQEKKVKRKNGKVEFEDGMFSFYWAVPFQFKKGETGKLKTKRKLGESNVFLRNKEGKDQKQYRKEEKLLGIDLGEYGFGYAIFDPETKKFVKIPVKNKKTGKIEMKTGDFIKIPILQNMRDEVAKWKDTQSSGIFSRPTTHLARVREQAAGTVRNQIHALALKYNAVPIYEDSVDGFESGGQRISKLYKTLKTADVIGGSSNKADEGVRNHFWGTGYAQIGGVIGAAKTSQTCRKCGRCATSEIQKNISNERSKNKNEQSEKLIKDLQEKLAQTKKAQRFESEEEKKKRGAGKKSRGTVERFKCQICENITDCDAQAAKNIALKYYFKLTATEKEVEDFKNDQGQLSTLKLFLKKSKEEKWRGL